ncbi:hypothetical protein ACGGZK_11520 [Agromyces sp. MMS24-K17]|uniref:hypothetical protein n=1 Tax=Agromyces sp. MMS24-K17 TaxID=3372850 RepID=UPI00375506AB
MNIETSAPARRRVKTSTYVVWGVVLLATLVVVIGLLAGGDASAIFQGIENAFDSRQGRRF